VSHTPPVMFRLIPTLLLLCVLVTPGPARTGDPVVLANQRIEVGVAPAHGLILGFGLAGKDNLLWVNPHPLSSVRHVGWANYGGEKLWWGPQIDWQAVQGRRFPPDEALDGVWTVTGRTEDRVALRSEVSPWVGVCAEREIALAPDGSGLVIRNRFIRVAPGAQRLQLWTVCMLVPPKWCWLDSQPQAGEPSFRNLRPEHPTGALVRHEPETGCVRAVPSPHFNERYLIGTRGAWIAAVYDEVILVHEVSPYPAGAYAEEVSLQLFSAPAYVELETLSGLVTPAVGQKMENTVRWRLLDRPKDLDEAALARWLRAQLKTPEP
jgi:hypothetical protein